MATSKKPVVEISSLFHHPETSDIILTIGGSKIHAYKHVLAKQSEYFKDLFRQEPELKYFSFPSEDDPACCTYMLQTISNCAIHSAPDKAHPQWPVDIVALTTKYEVHDLRASYIKILTEGMKNFDAVARFARFEGMVRRTYVTYAEHARGLRGLLVGVVVRNLDALKSRQEFKELVVEVPDFGIEIGRALKEERAMRDRRGDVRRLWGCQ